MELDDFVSEPVQMASTSRPAQALSQSDILSTASSIIQNYPTITSAYLFGSYAKGTAHPDSDVDIALFISDPCWKLRDIGGVLLDLEDRLKKKIDLSVCPPDDFVEKINKYWVPICGEPETPHKGLQYNTTLSTETMSSSSLDEIKDRLRVIEKPCNDLLGYVNHVNSIGGVSKLDNTYEHAICDCINRLGDTIKRPQLNFDAGLQKEWTRLRDHQYDLSKVWGELLVTARILHDTIEAKLK